jgi:hypothetical protein
MEPHDTIPAMMVLGEMLGRQGTLLQTHLLVFLHPLQKLKHL